MPRKAARKRPDGRARLRAELPRLLREDAQVRGEVLAVLSEYLTTREETAAILAELRQMRADFDRRMEELGRRIEEQGRRLEEQGQRIEELGRRLEEQGQRIEELGRRLEEQGRRLEEQGQRIEELGRRIEEQGRRIEEQGQRIEEHTLRLASLERTLGAIGARWGMMAEEAFREGVRALFVEQPDVQVERWRGYDESGRVFGYPAEVELDAVVRDGMHVLVEIKASVSAGDVVAFSRKAEVYAEATGRRPVRRLIVSPFVEPRARDVARRLGVEVCVSNAPPEL
jgi:hypothetical protein